MENNSTKRIDIAVLDYTTGNVNIHRNIMYSTDAGEAAEHFLTQEYGSLKDIHWLIVDSGKLEINEYNY